MVRTEVARDVHAAAAAMLLFTGFLLAARTCHGRMVVVVWRERRHHAAAAGHAAVAAQHSTVGCTKQESIHITAVFFITKSTEAETSVMVGFFAFVGFFGAKLLFSYF